MHAFLFDPVGKGDIELRDLAVDLLLRGRVGDRIGDDAPHVGERGLPVGRERREGHEGRIGRARDIVLLDLRMKEASAPARAAFEPAVDDRLRDRVGQQALIVDDRVLNGAPRAQDRIGEAARQIGLDPDRKLADGGQPADRLGRALRRDRIAEIGGDARRAGALPVAEPLLHQPGEHHRIGIARDHDHSVLGPVPAVVEGLHRRAVRAVQRRIGADRIAHREPLAGKEGLPGEIAGTLRRPAAFALFGEYDRALGPDIAVGQNRLADHAREQLEAFGQLGGVDVRDVELVGGVGGRGLGIGVIAEGRPKPLPGRDRLGLAEILALTEQQVF